MDELDLPEAKHVAQCVSLPLGCWASDIQGLLTPVALVADPVVNSF